MAIEHDGVACAVCTECAAWSGPLHDGPSVIYHYERGADAAMALRMAGEPDPHVSALALAPHLSVAGDAPWLMARVHMTVMPAKDESLRPARPSPRR